MTIKPLHNINEYQSLSSRDDDVTPVDRFIAKRAERSFKFVTAGAVTLAMIVAAVVLTIRKNSMDTVHIYQTAMAGSSGMKEISSGLLQFGNVRCAFNEETNSYSCPNLYGRPPGFVEIDTNSTYQVIQGFGGAFTEATALNFYKLPRSVQNHVIELYFGKDGIGLTLGRVHINSCDFSTKSYNFDNVDGDYELAYFDNEVTHDNAYMLPLIRLAMEASASPIKLMVSPWSPPAWMKTPVNSSTPGKTSMTGSASPNGLRDDPQVKLAWARYISRFISAYKKKGVPVWSVTPQNEPEFAAPWEACTYTAEYEKEFIDGYLGPVLRSDHPDIRILGFDHNKDHLVAWTKTLTGGKEGAKYVDGMAFHCKNFLYFKKKSVCFRVVVLFV
jgi:hypothetical protein